MSPYASSNIFKGGIAGFPEYLDFVPEPPGLSRPEYQGLKSEVSRFAELDA